MARPHLGESVLQAIIPSGDSSSGALNQLQSGAIRAIEVSSGARLLVVTAPVPLHVPAALERVQL